MSFRQFSTIVEKYNYLIVKNKWKSHNFQFLKRDRKKHRKNRKKQVCLFFHNCLNLYKKVNLLIGLIQLWRFTSDGIFFFLQIQFFMIFLFEFPNQFLAFFLLKRLNDLLVIFFCLFLTFKIVYLTIPSVCGKH